MSVKGIARKMRALLSGMALLTLATTILLPTGAAAQILSPPSREDAQACASAAPPPPPAANEPNFTPGHWWNPDREGTGWDVMRTGGQANGKMLVFWYTYDAQRRPIWLVSNNLQPDATIGTSTSGTWSSALNRVRWTNATDTGLGTSESGRPITEAIGEVSVRFVQNDSNRMAIRWRWLGHDRIECIYNFTRVSDFGGPAPSSLNVNSTNSGAYFEPTLDGYGSNLNIFQQTIGGVLKYQELHTLAIYDGRGSPVWVQGLREPPASVIPTDVPETINLNYFTSNYPGGVPLTACGRGTSGPCKTLVPNVGTLRRTFASVHGFHVDLDVEIPSNEIPGNGPAVSWHRPYGSTAPVYMTKLTDKDSILVDRLSCTAPPGATTCSVSVNWTSTNLGARAFRVNLDTGAHQLLLDAGGQATFSGERLDDLSVGARYRYQLHQCTEDQASQCPGGVANFNSPVFATTHQVKAIGSIAVPDAPIQSLAGELPAHDATIGAIDAQAGVSGGAATYTIPIKVPPGRRGMQPSLALSYSSRSGNGIAGMGWSLSGLSSVHRCPRTVAQDGYPRAVDFSALDALCLDGQRLIVKSGSAGNPGATYATEIDSFARITQLGGGLSSTSTYFKVEQKSGEIQYLGATPDAPFAQARSIPRGAPAPLSWLLVRRQDRSGNHATFNYLDLGYGEMLLSRIDYTGYGGDPGNRSVHLDYEDRAGGSSGIDVSSSFLAGTESRQSKRLKSIVTRAPGSNGALEDVRRYRLGYEPGANSGRSIVVSMIECAVDGGAEFCRPATSFDMLNAPHGTRTEQLRISDDPNVFPVTGGPLDGALAPSPGQAFGLATRILSWNLTSDFNGDGTRELVVQTGGFTRLNKAFLISLSADRAVTGILALTPMETQTLLEFPQSQADFDGDGRTDLITTVPHPTDSARRTIAFSSWRALPPGSPTTARPFAGGEFKPPVASNVTIPINPANATDVSSLQYAGDLDGDGRADLVIVERMPTNPAECARKIRLWLNALVPSGAPPTGFPFTAALAGSDTNTETGNPLCLRTRDGSTGSTEQIARVADHDGNGQLDFLIERVEAVSLRTNTVIDSVLFLHRSAAVTGGIGCPVGGSLDHNKLGFCLRSFSTLLQGDVNPRESAARELTHFWADFNGDGLDDWLYSDASGCTQPSTALCWTVRFATGAGMAGPAYSIRHATGNNRGLELNAPDSPTRSRYERFLRVTDTNSDGRAELLVPDRDRPFASLVCTYEDFANDREPPRAVDPARATTPENADPAEEIDPSTLVVPSAPAYICPTTPYYSRERGYEHTVNMVPDTNSGDFQSAAGVQFKNDTDLDGTPGETLPEGQELTGPEPVYSFDWVSHATDLSLTDFSTYRLRSYSFSAGAATLAGQLGSTVSMVQDPHRVTLSGGRSDDVFGDGLSDAMSSLPTPSELEVEHLAVPFKYCPGDCASAPLVLGVPQTLDDSSVPLLWRGLTIERGIGAQERTTTLPPKLSEMMVKATDGLGNIAQWEHFPLASSAGRDPASTPMYSVAARDAGSPGYIDDQHLYFSSSMPVVARFEQSNGLGGLNATQYGYTEAMYNVAGRGFQGFRSIIEEDLVNRRRNRTVFHQKFPLTGLVERSIANDVTGRITDIDTDLTNTKLIRRETNEWRCVRTNRGACVSTPGMPTVFAPFLDSQTVENRDPLNGSTLLSTTTTSNFNSQVSGWDYFGNLLRQSQTLVENGAHASISFHNTSTVSAYSVTQVDLDNWWLDRKNSETVTTSIAYAAVHTLPAGASSPGHVLNREFAWNGDRTLMWERVQNGVPDQQKITTFGYRSSVYGLPSSITTEAWGDTNLSRQTQTAYSSDGYFSELLTNPLFQASTITTRARDGQPSRSVDINGLATDFAYDAFGRLTRVDFPGRTAGSQRMPSKRTAVAFCNSWVCADDFMGRSKYTVTEVQDGSPTTTTTFDTLNRPIRVKSRAFNGAETLSETGYSSHGHVMFQVEPHALGATTTYRTSTPGWDVLGRPIRKSFPLRVNGTLSSRINWYYYSGRETTIEALGGGSTLLPNMYRYTDSLGRTFRTLDSHGGATNFWFDATGNAVAIKDAAGSVTRASYNAVGQRTSMQDPNKGAWSFGYNALGELLRQTDARGVVTWSGYDKLGRMTSRQATVDLDGVNGLDTVADSWVFDPLGTAGELGTSKRTINGAVERSESWGYDDLVRPSSSQTTQQVEYGSGSTVFGQNYSYDAYYGRLKEKFYPNGERVWYRYDRYGHPESETDPVTQTVYRQTLAVDGRGQISQERFGNNVITGSYVNDPASGQVEGMAYAVGGQTRRSLGYAYDGFGNVSSATMGATTEIYSYDALHRLTQTVRSGQAQGSVGYAFDAVGNPQKKTDFSIDSPAAYAYTGGTCGGGPNAVKSVALSIGGSRTFCYDPNGNQISDNAGMGARYDHQDLPTQINRFGGAASQLRYGADSQRIRQWGGGDGSIVYLGPDYQRHQSLLADKLFLGNYAVVTRESGTRRVDYLLKDRLGSIDAVLDSAGTIKESRGYDAFGKPRDGNWRDVTPPRLNPTALTTSRRGFTQHEHLNSLELIHMNGRIYDYALGRFLSVDPIIQFPENSQSLNPYSYILNNPLSGTDPTGYCVAETGSKIKSCKTESVSFSDGSSKSVSYNSRNVADVSRAARSLDTAIAQKTANGAELTGVNGKQIRTAVDIGAPMKEGSNAHQQYQRQQGSERADQITSQTAEDVVRFAIQPLDSAWSFFEDVGEGRYLSAAFSIGIPKLRTGAKVVDAVEDGVKRAADSRVKLRKATREQIATHQPRNSTGQMVDPNTGQPLKPGEIDVGHRTGQEWRTRKQMHEQAGNDRRKVIETENDPDLYHLEDRTNNRSHKYER